MNSQRVAFVLIQCCCFFFSLSDKYDVHFDNKNRGTFKFLMNNQRVEFALIK